MLFFKWIWQLLSRKDIQITMMAMVTIVFDWPWWAISAIRLTQEGIFFLLNFVLWPFSLMISGPLYQACLLYYLELLKQEICMGESWWRSRLRSWVQIKHSEVCTHDRGQDYSSQDYDNIRCLLYGKQEKFNLFDVISTLSDLPKFPRPLDIFSYQVILNFHK